MFQKLPKLYSQQFLLESEATILQNETQNCSTITDIYKPHVPHLMRPIDI